MAALQRKQFAYDGSICANLPANDGAMFLVHVDVANSAVGESEQLCVLQLSALSRPTAAQQNTVGPSLFGLVISI